MPDTTLLHEVCRGTAVNEFRAFRAPSPSSPPEAAINEGFAMCQSITASAAEALWSAPKAAPGEAVDPIRLEPVDEVRVTILVDNFVDALMESSTQVGRAGLTVGRIPAAVFEQGSTVAGLVAEHGFSAMVTVRRGQHEATVMFDAGVSPDGAVTNADRLGVDLGDVHAVVLSHGHHDHAGGLGEVLHRRRRDAPLVLHPDVWAPRRLDFGGGAVVELPTLSRQALSQEGVEIIERRAPSLLLDGAILLTGEVDRTTEYELGMPPPHQQWAGGEWVHDPLVVDDQALIVNLRGRGLVVLTGCGHAGAVNILRHACRLTQVDTVCALIGGLHTSGRAFEPTLPRVVADIAEMRPALIGTGHCTGWRAQHALAAALPDAWAPSASGTTFRLAAAGAATSQ